MNPLDEIDLLFENVCQLSPNDSGRRSSFHATEDVDIDNLQDYFSSLSAELQDFHDVINSPLAPSRRQSSFVVTTESLTINVDDGGDSSDDDSKQEQYSLASRTHAIHGKLTHYSNLPQTPMTPIPAILRSIDEHHNSNTHTETDTSPIASTGVVETILRSIQKTTKKPSSEETDSYEITWESTFSQQTSPSLGSKHSSPSELLPAVDDPRNNVYESFHDIQTTDLRFSLENIEDARTTSTRAIREQWTVEVQKEALRQTQGDSEYVPFKGKRLVDVDERLRADFSMWTHNQATAAPAGPLTWQGMKTRYSGLYKSTLAMGPAEGVFHCNGLLECLVRPDIDLKQIMAVMYRAATSLKYNFTFIQKSMALIERQPPPQDQLLASLTSWTNATASAANSAATASERSGWDHIEAQVCISKELQQRVLLIAFVKQGKPPASFNELPHTALQSMEEVFDLAKAYLVSHRLSLSSLYFIPFKQACPHGDLDAHFRSQLQNVFRENMWSSLHELFEQMDEYVQSCEESNKHATVLMEPIYKQHNLDLPVRPPVRKLSDFPLNNEQSHQSLLRATKQEIAMIDSNELRNTDNESKDGMVRCLLLLSCWLAHLQKKFDIEHVAMLQQKHDCTIAMIDDMTTFRRCLLTSIAFDSHAEVSQLGKSFSTLFQGFPVPSLSSSSTTTPAMVTNNNHHSRANNNSSNSSLVAQQEWKPGTTTDIVKARLESYRKSMENLSLLSPTTLSISTLSVDDDDYKNLADDAVLSSQHRKPFNVVLYYFACFISTKPGTLYITPYYIYFTTSTSAMARSMSLFGLNQSNNNNNKDCQAMKQLDSVTIQPTSNQYKAIITSQTLRLSFRSNPASVTATDMSDKTIEWTVTPMYCDCKRVQQLLADVQAVFAEYWG